jgi:asparagine synthase (glutamine-hydrolysing)
LVQAALKELLNDRNAPILQIVDPNALKGLLNAEYSWPWYGQLMRLPQTIAYMLQLNFWLKHYKVRVV